MLDARDSYVVLRDAYRVLRKNKRKFTAEDAEVSLRYGAEAIQKGKSIEKEIASTLIDILPCVFFSKPN